MSSSFGRVVTAATLALSLCGGSVSAREGDTPAGGVARDPGQPLRAAVRRAASAIPNTSLAALLALEWRVMTSPALTDERPEFPSVVTMRASGSCQIGLSSPCRVSFVFRTSSSIAAIATSGRTLAPSTIGANEY